MNTQDFSALKRKVYLAYHRDGLLDMVAGFVVLGFGIEMLTGNVVFLTAGWMIVPFYFLIKQRATFPRFGYVRFDSHKKSIKWGFSGVAIGVAVFLLILFFTYFASRQPASSDMAALTQRYHMVPISGLIFGLPALGAAIILGLRRYYLYAFLTVGLPALGGWLDIETYIPIIVLGLTMLAFGAVLLGTFLKAYPLDHEAATNGNG